MPVLSSLGFQRGVTAAALAVDAYQNLLVRFQSLATGDQILRVFDRLEKAPLRELASLFHEFPRKGFRPDVTGAGTVLGAPVALESVCHLALASLLV
jgi:hypothetical protein